MAALDLIARWIAAIASWIRLAQQPSGRTVAGATLATAALFA
jgi:hypothetical protein